MVNPTGEAHVRSRFGFGLIAAAPLAAAGVAALLVVVGWLVRAAPFWPLPDLTLSEAAAVKDAGEVARLIEFEGRDPNRPWPVRPGLLDGTDARELTPLQAALAIGREEMTRVLIAHGARPSAGAAGAALICRAMSADEYEMAEMLVQVYDGPDPRAHCGAPSAQHK
jgi:hypothetical protein